MGKNWMCRAGCAAIKDRDMDWPLDPRLIEIFEEIFDKKPKQREAMKRRHCMGNPNLSRQLDDLLAKYDRLHGGAQNDDTDTTPGAYLVGDVAEDDPGDVLMDFAEKVSEILQEQRQWHNGGVSSSA